MRKADEQERTKLWVDPGFAAFDGNGNVAALAKATDGTNSAVYEYSPFGELLRVTGPMSRANSLRFSTKYEDDETDLLYYGYRYYNAAMGRWVSRDPIAERGGLNIYAFVVNCPCVRVDKLGRNQVTIEFEQTSTFVTATVVGSNPCLGPFQIVFHLSNASHDLNSTVLNDAKFFADGYPITPTNWLPSSGSNGGSWDVPSTPMTRPCAGSVSGVTLLMLDSRKDFSAPFYEAGGALAEWSFACDSCCQLVGTPKVHLVYVPPTTDKPLK